jgi:hypothetical protein
MTFQEIVQEIESLSLQERKMLLSLIADSLTEGEKEYDLLDFEGVGAHLADATDPQEYINQLRNEWDQRP